MNRPNLLRTGLRNALGLALLSLAAMLAPPQSTAAVVVDQSPLTVIAPLAPDMVLMLDDSGSMNWNFMPDIGYINGGNSVNSAVGGDTDNNSLINNSNNGVYYDPTATYTPPYKVDGTVNTNSPGLTSAYADGFLNTSKKVDITQYANASNYSTTSQTYTAAYDDTGGSGLNGKSYLANSTYFSKANYLPTCASGYTLSSSGPNVTCISPADSTTPTCASGTFNSSTGKCVTTSPTPTCSNGSYNSSNGDCESTPTCPTNYTFAQIGTGYYCTQTSTPTCPSGGTFSTNGNTPVCTTTASCPSGYGLSGSSCTATPTCPSGYSLSGSSCVATPTCPSGFTLSGSKCTAAPSVCPSGYTLSGSSCSVTPTCPSGFSVSGSSCVKASTTCPDTGYSWSSSSLICTKSSTGGSAHNCSGSGTYNSSLGKCTEAPTCPSNSSFSTSQGTCVSNTAPSCPTGGTLNSGSCTASPTCSSGSTLSSGSCVITPPTCSSGSTYQSSSNSCVSNTAPSCKTGGSLQSGSCIATPTCSSGTLNAGSCAVSNPSVTCASGSFQTSGTYINTCLVTQSLTSKNNCPSGSTISSNQTYCSSTPSCPSGSYSSSTQSCPNVTTTATCPSGYSLSSSAPYTCNKPQTTASAQCTTNATDTLDPESGFCINKKTTGATTYNFFQFTTGTYPGPYTLTFVASASSTPTACSVVPSPIVCVYDNDTSGKAAPAGVSAGQNIANWFSYYRQRILTAKSGLQIAFNNLDSNVRFGFGSINGNADGKLPSGYYSGSTANIAAVQPFGTAASPQQRSNFWTWSTAVSPNGSTVLRGALNDVGSYYSTTPPWQNSATDKTALACRQAYTIVTTDGFWNDKFTLSSPANADGNNGTAITGPSGQSYTYTAASPYSDTYSSTLADVAMKYWRTDLQPSLANEVPISPEDPAFWQHMSTFTMGLGFTPTGIAPSGTSISQIFSWANGGASISGFSWPQPSSDSINNIADMAHAAVNGHGGFYSVTKPADFYAGITDVLRRVAERVGAGASLAANSTKLQTGTSAYQAIFTSGVWTGDLRAYSVDPASGALATAASWIASDVLPAFGSAPLGRNIYTYNNSGSFTSGFIPLNASAVTGSTALSSAQLSALLSSFTSAQLSALGSSASAQQTAIVNYLTGDSSNELSNGGLLRNRKTALGDIVNSQPVYEGGPDPNLENNKTFSGSGGYVSYAAGNASRTPGIWVAANDGMVHEFNASTGVEIFAYLPGGVISAGVGSLANTTYGTSVMPHVYYNDGNLTIADVYSASLGWRTVLVGTTGRGPAQTIYALDVTSTTSPTLLWERSAIDGVTNSNYIGQMVGTPIIAQTSNGTWSVLVGNGYNSSAGTAALLQFDVFSGALTVHATDSQTSNGLSTPAVWIANAVNNVSTMAYAGDLQGRVWSFPLSSSSSSGTIAFQALSATGVQQPITAALQPGMDPATGNLWMFFGTGGYLTQTVIAPTPANYLVETELASTAVQTWYGIIVQAGASQPSSIATTASTTRSSLAQRSIIAEVEPNSTATPPTLGFRALSAPTTNDMVGKSGWYLDLVPPSGTPSGERMVVGNQFVGSLLIGTTRIPTSTDPCNPTGSGWVMTLNPFTGAPPTSPFFTSSGDQTFTVNGHTYVVDGLGFTNVPAQPIFVGNTMLMSFDNGTTANVQTSGSNGYLHRTSWREIFGQ